MNLPVLLFDADCALCTRAATWARTLRWRTIVIPLQSIDLAGAGVDPQRATTDMPFISADGEISYGAAAITAALGTGHTGHRALAAVLRSFPFRHLAARAYRLVARNRHRLPGGSAACDISRQ